MISPTTAQVEALYDVLRKAADDSGYGGFIGDEQVQAMALAGAQAVVNATAPKKD